MGIRNIPLVNGEFYHLYNRGNSKQIIFLDEEDYSRFIKLLYLCNSNYNINFRDDIVSKHIDAFDFDRGENLISIGAWCLMPNHFHLYVYTSPKQGLGEVEGMEEDTINNITKIMHKICTAYSKYFNKKYKRTGKLFEDKFKSVHVKNDNQAKYLFSYIHLNPIKLIDSRWKEEGIKDIKKSLEFLSKYKWSSYFDYKGIGRPEGRILNLNHFPKYFSSFKDFDKEIITWLKYKNKEN